MESAKDGISGADEAAIVILERASEANVQKYNTAAGHGGTHSTRATITRKRVLNKQWKAEVKWWPPPTRRSGRVYESDITSARNPRV